MSPNKKIFIIIPTFNERDNVPNLIREIFDLDIENLKILFVDDNSPDGTGDLIEELKKKEPRLEIIHRLKKMGLGSAYIEGFKKVLSFGADYIFQMDADFSHDPKYLPIFLEKIKEADLILGSRYIRRGGIENWNLIRRLISFLGNFYARTVLRLPLKDLTSGFRCFRREVLENIELDKINSQGYVFLIELVYRTYKKGFKIEEIPIIFTERIFGKSKFNFKIILEAFLKILTLRFKKL